jgi:hypothetical protein
MHGMHPDVHHERQQKRAASMVPLKSSIIMPMMMRRGSHEKQHDLVSEMVMRNFANCWESAAWCTPWRGWTRRRA